MAVKKKKKFDQSIVPPSLLLYLCDISSSHHLASRPDLLRAKFKPTLSIILIHPSKHTH